MGFRGCRRHLLELALELQCWVHVVRVSSKDNIADIPSREIGNSESEFFHAFGVKLVPPGSLVMLSSRLRELHEADALRTPRKRKRNQR